MVRKYSNTIRCVKDWNGTKYGWWCWSDDLKTWRYIHTDNLQWILDFIPESERPTIEEVQAEAWGDIVYSHKLNQLIFIDRKFTEDFNNPLFTDEELQTNLRTT
jgi:hypothetical protein